MFENRTDDELLVDVRGGVGVGVRYGLGTAGEDAGKTLVSRVVTRKPRSTEVGELCGMQKQKGIKEGSRQASASLHAG